MGFGAENLTAELLLSYSTLSNKWKFEQMEISAKTALLFIREQMEIRTNGNFWMKITKF